MSTFTAGAFPRAIRNKTYKALKDHMYPDFWSGYKCLMDFLVADLFGLEFETKDSYRYGGGPILRKMYAQDTIEALENILLEIVFPRFERDTFCNYVALKYHIECDVRRSKYAHLFEEA